MRNFWAVLIWAVATACGGSSESLAPGGSAGTGGSAGEEGTTCEDGETRECVGPGACRGGQVCDEGEWSACDCGGSETGGGSGSGGAGKSGSSGQPGKAGGGAGGEAGGAFEGGSSGQSAGESGAGGAPDLDPLCIKATGAITLKQSTFFANGDTFTIGDGVHDPVVFEFDLNDDGVADGNVPLVFDGTENEAQLAALITSAINGVDDLNVTATHDGPGGGEGGQGGNEEQEISLVSDAYGDLGNFAIGDTVGNPNFVRTGMSGGAAVKCALRPTACSSDDACSSRCDAATGLCEGD